MCPMSGLWPLIDLTHVSTLKYPSIEYKQNCFGTKNQDRNWGRGSWTLFEEGATFLYGTTPSCVLVSQGVYLRISLRKQVNSLKILVAGTRSHGMSLPFPPGVEGEEAIGPFWFKKLNELV